MYDTIFALASAKGRAGVSVIRISGSDATKGTVGFYPTVPVPGRGLRAFRAADGTVVDQVLIVTFQHGASFTGEETVEIHCHGSPAVVSRILDELSKAPNFRLAEAGEFTRRALENECLDLAQVEGLGALIEAETEVQRAQAFRLMSGKLADRVQEWRNKLIRAASLLEAVIDFADEDIPQDVTPEVTGLLNSVLLDLKSEADGSQIAERIRDGFEVAIVGPPNMGKSSLLNALAGRDAAITSEIAGTTRDVIELRMDLRGLPVTLIDTAGLRQAQDEIERIGVVRGVKRAEAADLRVFLTEDGDWKGFEGLNPNKDDLVVVSKADLNPTAKGLCVSSLTGDGLDNLVEQVFTVLNGRAQTVLTSTHARHRAGMQGATSSLESALQTLDLGEIAAAEIREATVQLSSLIGVVDVENLLDEIFASFCLGK